MKREFRKHPLAPWVKAQIGMGEKQTARLLSAIKDPYWNDLHGRPRTVSELWAFSGLHVVPASHSTRDTQKGSVGGATTELPAGRPPADAQIETASGAQPHKPPASQKPTEKTHGADAGGVTRAGGDTSQESPDTHAAVAGVAPRRTRGQTSNWNTNARTRTYVIAESCMKNRRSPYRTTYDEGRTKYANALHTTDCRQCKTTAGEPLRDGHKHARAMRLVMKTILRDLWIEAKRIHQEES